MNMDFSIFKKNQELNIWSIFKPGKNEIRFILLSLVLPVILFILVSLEILFPKNMDNFVLFFAAYLILIIYIHKIVSKCSEFDLFKAILHIAIIYMILTLFSSMVYLSEFSESQVLFFFSEFFSVFSVILTTALSALGIANLFFQKRINLKEIILIFIFSLFILFLSHNSVLFTLVSNISSQLITSEINFTLSQILTIPFILNGFSGVFFYYAYKKLEGKFIQDNKEIAFFSLFGFIIFIIEYANGLLAIPSSVPKVENINMIELFLINFRVFIYYFLLGIFFSLYRKNKKVTK